MLSVVVLHPLRLTACGLLFLVACHCLLLSVGVDVWFLCWCCVLFDRVCFFVVRWFVCLFLMAVIICRRALRSLFVRRCRLWFVVVVAWCCCFVVFVVVVVLWCLLLFCGALCLLVVVNVWSGVIAGCWSCVLLFVYCLSLVGTVCCCLWLRDVCGLLLLIVACCCCVVVGCLSCVCLRFVGGCALFVVFGVLVLSFCLLR